MPTQNGSTMARPIKAVEQIGHKAAERIPQSWRRKITGQTFSQHETFIFLGAATILVAGVAGTYFGRKTIGRRFH